MNPLYYEKEFNVNQGRILFTRSVMPNVWLMEFDFYLQEKPTVYTNAVDIKGQNDGQRNSIFSMNIRPTR